MALFTQRNVEDWLHLPDAVANDVASPLNESIAEREVRQLIDTDEYDRIEANKTPGDDEYDRVAQAEALYAFASYVGNRGTIRLSDIGGLVRDIAIINQQQTIRQLLSQDETEQVQARLRQQAEQVLDDLLDANAHVWGI